MKQALRTLLCLAAGSAAAVVAVAQPQQQAAAPVSSTPRGFGDLFNQAPPHVDKALRERVEKFYALHQEKKWRQADALVHEESKDVFFNAEKLTFRSFKIVGITYEENYSRAKVVIDLDTDLFMPGFGKVQVHRPLASSWRLDQDQWWWNVPAVDIQKTPFGDFNPGKGEATTEMPQIGTPASLENFKKSLEELKNKVQVEKTEVVLPSHEPAEAEIVITNAWDNPVHLTVDVSDLPGLTLKIDKPLLPAGEKTKLRVISKPETKAAKPSLQALLTVEEISKVEKIQIVYLPPPNRDPKPGSRIDPVTGKVIEPPAGPARPVTLPKNQ